MLKITEALIVNGVIIANGVADSDGDVLTKKDIKTIFTKYQRDTDTMHTNIKNDGVEVFASWISEIDTTIAGKVVPAGSWLATLKVTNEKLIQCIEQGKLNGFSLGSVSQEAMTPKYWFINKSLNYRDMKDIEEVIPLYISFVDKPANQYGWEVMTYDAYINKNEKDVEEMTESQREDMIPVSFVEKLMDKLSINKSETVEKAEEEPAIIEEPAEASADETVTALFEKLDTIIEQNNQILEGLQKSEEEEDESVDEEEEIEKAEETESEEEKKEEDESSEEKKDDEEIEKAEEPAEEEKEEDVRVEKRETSMIENQNTQSHTTFYQKTSRDHLGRKIRK